MFLIKDPMKISRNVLYVNQAIETESKIRLFTLRKLKQNYGVLLKKLQIKGPNSAA